MAAKSRINRRVLRLGRPGVRILPHSKTTVDTNELTRSIPAPPDALLARGPQIVQATVGGPLRTVKPFTPEVRANIDYELVDKSIDFMRRQKAAGNSSFLYLPLAACS
jgi:hypothetical protein